MGKLTKQELLDVINGIKDNNPPEVYLNTVWYRELLRQLKEVKS